MRNIQWPKEPRFWIQLALTVVFVVLEFVLFFGYDRIMWTVGQRNTFFAGQVLLFFAWSVILPDEFAKWWGSIDNTHRWTKPLAIILGIIAFIGIVIVGYGSAILTAILNANVPEWGWYLAIIAIALGAIAWIARRLAKKP